MAFTPAAVYSALTSDAKQLGIFRKVLTHEPKAAPVSLPCLAVWWNDPLRGIASSGLASVSVVLGFRARLYQCKMLDKSDPEETAEAALLANVSKLCAGWAAGLTLGGQARAVDLLGAEGAPLTAAPGYIQHEQTLYRVAEITIPVIINDAWAEVA